MRTWKSWLGAATGLLVLAGCERIGGEAEPVMMQQEGQDARQGAVRPEPGLGPGGMIPESGVREHTIGDAVEGRGLGGAGPGPGEALPHPHVDPTEPQREMTGDTGGVVEPRERQGIDVRGAGRDRPQGSQGAEGVLPEPAP